MKEYQEQHKTNTKIWNKWQTQQFAINVALSKDALVQFEKQLQKAKTTNTRMLKLLADISTFVKNFKALD